MQLKEIISITSMGRIKNHSSRV
uniref:Uncharacterized protein n=1 Tax=Rhizophora mucronata TaxID=61149 RepID=A0A2P2MZA7_RHIMU